MKALFVPYRMVVGVLAGLLANAVFRKVWTTVSSKDAVPGPTDKRVGWGEVAAAAVLQGAVMRGTRAVADRLGAKGFEKATGTWPGQQSPG
jgi:hypothetical protein